MEQEIKLAFHLSTYPVLHREVWQVLFNIYSESGGDLKNLDNLIVDYDYCKNLFENLKIGETKLFLWCCSPNTFITQLIPSDKYWEDFDFMIEISTHKIIYEVEINIREAVFTRHK